MLYIDINRAKHEKIFLSENIRPSLSHDTWYLASPCGLCVWGQKGPRPGGHIFYIGLYREKHRKIFLSETIRLKALIIGLLYHLVDLYQFCSHYAPVAKMTPSQRCQGHGQLSTDTYM